VSLRLPADGAYLAVLRTAAAGLASRLNFTLDDIEDLRIAVDEACAMLLPRAASGASLECAFELKPGELDIAVSLATTDGALPSRDTFAWTVLTALAGEVDASADGTTVTITMAKKSSTDLDLPA
jgi:serine/threonine-protein kinase RsbW